MKYRPLIDRMIPAIPVHMESKECWPWHGRRNYLGYPVVWGDGKSHLGHRRVYELFYGLPFYSLHRHQVVMHTCDNPSCCNPLHLRLGTQAENVADRDRKGRHRTATGTAHHAAKLNEDAVREIRETRGWKALSEKYGVSRSTIYMVRQGKIWKDVK